MLVIIELRNLQKVIDRSIKMSRFPSTYTIRNWYEITRTYIFILCDSFIDRKSFRSLHSSLWHRRTISWEVMIKVYMGIICIVHFARYLRLTTLGLPLLNKLRTQFNNVLKISLLKFRTSFTNKDVVLRFHKSKNICPIIKWIVNSNVTTQQ